METKKEQLIDGLVDYLLTHGPTDLSLRPMAASVGSSARLLIFHFGSKEKMIGEVLAEIQRRLQKSLSELLGASPKIRRVAPLREFWDWALKDRNWTYLRLMYELQVLNVRQQGPARRQMKRDSLKWLELVKTALPAGRRDSTLATLICGVFDGLMLEMLSTGDRPRTTKALDLFITLAHEGVSPTR